jgi:chorismate mutase
MTQDSNLLRIPDAVDSRRLEVMQFVAKMKEAAERCGAGFIGGFITDDGEKFVMTNLDPEDANLLLPNELRD